MSCCKATEHRDIHIPGPGEQQTGRTGDEEFCKDLFEIVKEWRWLDILAKPVQL
jgi:hypothetical protein